MALKKSELYSSLWSSCDELRGGMDASQYKDYVLSLLFIKYVSDKYSGVPYAPIKIPAGSDFKAMVALKGATDIGDQINKHIIAPLAAANEQLNQADFPDFNDSTKLGDGKEKVEKLTNLIAIFENRALDFSKNRAEGDDILGDAYEYLMRHFATESGKSKGQFYTPAEVSRIMAQIIGIGQAQTSTDTTVYDPTCGSGSLLLKVGDEARAKVSLYGQEKDSATSGLARMNMILHDYPTAQIAPPGNTLTDPKFKHGDTIKQFDFVVANPPFSDKRWSTGLDPLHDPHARFKGFGIPPAKQGDYAYLLHNVRSLKSTGSSACILPHGVLFRGNAEADIRRALVRKGYIKGIIGLPANLFYGTGIPACIVVVDKKDAQARKGIFMIDASQGFMKEGPKNRLRSQDIHKIVDAFNKALDLPGYSRTVPYSEIEKNNYNLNLPRYIDSQKTEDRQDIEGHLRGGIPQADIDALQPYWEVCPGLKSTLFSEVRPGYLDLAVEKAAIKTTIFEHSEFSDFVAKMAAQFDAWRDENSEALKALTPGSNPKNVIFNLSEGLLAHYTGKPLIDKYDVYQHLMDYWAETMQDDVYAIALDGWKAETSRIIEKDKKGKEKDKGWTCDLIPKSYIVARYFAKEQAEIDELHAKLEATNAAIAELDEEHSGEDGLLAEGRNDKDKVAAALLKARRKALAGELDAGFFKRYDKLEKQGGAEEDIKAEFLEAIPDFQEVFVIDDMLKLLDEGGALGRAIKTAEAELDAAAYAKYPELTEAEIKTLVVDDKWMARINADIHGEIDGVSQSLTQRVRVLAERYETPMPKLASRVTDLEGKVADHLTAMGFAW
ncbi:type I restriction-modification system subunit M [Altericroceibacterium endophyticum]|uniref:site-specific DNA-methyltransferase (adenine-specific) n=1 Tax=Altericroceibacterium endophyticum TaxID=1808508 RepID=A0A6I4T4I2_9SPHN|nr:type I restriction-modification system subunit M [Altericroceibacterium endophyticum]MXO65299.1 type I restriction-modification system subunit M [Altericroceibacterium endophyticum]